jgi:hypothetical protein
MTTISTFSSQLSTNLCFFKPHKTLLCKDLMTFLLKSCQKSWKQIQKMHRQWKTAKNTLHELYSLTRKLPRLTSCYANLHTHLNPIHKYLKTIYLCSPSTCNCSCVPQVMSRNKLQNHPLLIGDWTNDLDRNLRHKHRINTNYIAAKTTLLLKQVQNKKPEMRLHQSKTRKHKNYEQNKQGLLPSSP